MNKRITPKERGLIKGALRRVFSRSDLRRKVLDASEIKHFDSSRPRVKKWSCCSSCSKIAPKYLMEVDHKLPVVPVTSAFSEMTLDELADRIWCLEDNLWAICESCHDLKSASENKERRKNKKERDKK